MATPAVPMPLAQLPNALTIVRLALVPVFVGFVLTSDGAHSWTAGTVFLIAGITDQIDGILARRWRVESDFGRIADPLADRLMIDAAVILLVIADRLPWVGLVIVFARDLVLIAGLKLFAPRGISVDVNLLGKAATWILYLSVGCVTVTYKKDDWPIWLFWAGVTLALVSAAVYIARTWKVIRQ
jgi:CDP-diacylglycerol--glycerol-3-phosphate 3-phosphatidyltransferase